LNETGTEVFATPEVTDPNKRDAVRLWLRNLRSGEFDQAPGMLRDADGYCCLGVACVQFAGTLGN